ncbi:MAG: porin family protein [Muribaculaceae bacterium]
MKRIIFAILLLICALAPAMAETHYKPHIAVGVHGGMTLSKVSFSPSVPQKWGDGFTGGVSFSYSEEKLVGILAEINVVQRGWSENFEDSPLTYQRTGTYISLPVMTHIHFGGKRVKCIVNLGPEFSYLLSESTSSNFDYANPESDPSWPEKSRMTEQLTTPIKHKFDYGITAGAGVEFWVNPRHSVYLEARFYYGLGNIFPASKSDTFGASRLMNLAVTFGYNFRLK